MPSMLQFQQHFLKVAERLRFCQGQRANGWASLFAEHWLDVTLGQHTLKSQVQALLITQSIVFAKLWDFKLMQCAIKHARATNAVSITETPMRKNG